MTTKMGTSVTPVNAPASCGWRERFAGRGLMSAAPRSCERDALGDLHTWCFEYVSVMGDENTLGYWLLGPLYQLWRRKF